MGDIDQYLLDVLKRCEADNVHDLGAASQTLIFELAIEARTDLPRLARYCQKLREALKERLCECEPITDIPGEPHFRTCGRCEALNLKLEDLE